jgi:hypothetical protein
VKARQFYELTEAESQAILNLGLTVSKQPCGRGDTAFLAPFVNVLSAMQRSRKRSSEEVAQLRRLTR